MGVCICSKCPKSTIKEVFLDYKQNSIMSLYSNNNLESFKPDDPGFIIKHASISPLNSERFFIVGGKSHKSLSRTCIKIEPTIKKITYHSPLDTPSQKGYCFEYSDYLYYIFGEQENKENSDIQRLNIKENYWEKFLPKLPYGKERVSLNSLKEAGAAFNNDSIYIISGSIPQARNFSNTILKLTLPELKIENLGFKFESKLLKPCPFFISDELYIFHKKSSTSSQLIKIDLNSKTMESILNESKLELKRIQPYYKLSEKEIIIHSDPKLKFSFSKKLTVERYETPDQRENIKNVNWEKILIQKKKSIETKINPIFCNFDPQIQINYSSSTAPVIELPEVPDQTRPFNPLPIKEENKITSNPDKSFSLSSEHKSRNGRKQSDLFEPESSENNSLLNRDSQIKTIKGFIPGYKSPLYPPSNYTFKNKNDRNLKIDDFGIGQSEVSETEKIQSYQNESNLNQIISNHSELNQSYSNETEGEVQSVNLKSQIYDRSGRHLKLEETPEDQEIIIDSPVNPFNPAGSID